jgi:hypothetical protein
MSVQIQLRNDTAANWTSENPTLAVGEVGVENDTNQFKIGDGVTAWNDLEYAVAEPNTLGIIGDQTEYNPTYKVTGFGSYTIDLPAGAYFVTAKAAANVLIGGQTIQQTSSGMFFFDTPQTSMNVLPTGSSGAVSWTQRGGYAYEGAQYYTARPLTFGNDLYLLGIHRNSGAITFSGQLRVSTTGTGNWAHPLNITNNGTFFGGAYGAGRYVFPVVGGDIGGELWSSTNAWHWERSFSGQNFYFARFLNNRFLAGGDSGVLRTSTDGVTWSAVNSSAQSAFQSRSMRSAAYGNGVYVVCGGEGQLITSTDTVTWTTRNSNAVGQWLETAAFGSGTFVVAGNGQLRTSTDGVTWAIRTFGNQEPIFEILFQNGIFIAAGRYSVQTSVDGTTWTLRTNPTTYASNNDYHSYGIIHGNGLYIMGGMNFQSNTGTHHAILWTTTSFGESVGGTSYISFEKKGEITTLTQ